MISIRHPKYFALIFFIELIASFVGNEANIDFSTSFDSKLKSKCSEHSVVNQFTFNDPVELKSQVVVLKMKKVSQNSFLVNQFKDAFGDLIGNCFISLCCENFFVKSIFMRNTLWSKGCLRV